MRRLDLGASLAMAGESVIFSYAAADSRGNAVLPDAVISRLRNVFPGLSAQPVSEAARQSSPLSAMMRMGLPLDLGTFSEDDAGRLSALSAWAGETGQPDPAALMRAAASSTVYSDPIGRDMARRIYDGPSAMSVSRLERFAECPFRHFVERGLKPSVWEERAVTPQDVGNAYHAALERFVGAAGDVAGLSDGQIMERIDSIADDVLRPCLRGPMGEDDLGLSQARRIRAIVRRAATTVAEQLRGGAFRPFGVEMRFGEGGDAVVLRTAEGDMRLHGVIDRVDVWQQGETTWYRIIDYKSSQQELDMVRLYAGLQLQIVIYMGAVLRHGGKPAGAFYFHVDDPLVDTDLRDPEAVDQERLKALRLCGVYINDSAVMDAMAGDFSRAVQTKRWNKDLDEAAFDRLIEYAQAAAGDLAAQIVAGRTDIDPKIVGGQRTACTGCTQQSVCGQDRQLGGMPRDPAPGLTSAEAFRLITDNTEDIQED